MKPSFSCPLIAIATVHMCICMMPQTLHHKPKLSYNRAYHVKNIVAMYFQSCNYSTTMQWLLIHPWCVYCCMHNLFLLFHWYTKVFTCSPIHSVSSLDITSHLPTTLWCVFSEASCCYTGPRECMHVRRCVNLCDHSNIYYNSWRKKQMGSLIWLYLGECCI